VSEAMVAATARPDFVIRVRQRAFFGWPRF
jgi:hypothetical protein